MKPGAILLATALILSALLSCLAQTGGSDTSTTRCSCASDVRCHCVPNEQCEGGKYKTPDVASIDLRVDGSSRDCTAAETCCEVGDDEERDDAPGVGCGKRNFRGVGDRDSLLKPAHEETTEFGEFPWMVAIFDSVGYKCGGVLLTARVVLSASHCVNESAGTYTVNVGDHNLLNQNEAFAHQSYAVKSIVRYPKYKKLGINALSILLLAKPVQYANHISPVCLPEQTQALVESECVLTHWGSNYNGNRTFQDALRKVPFPLQDRDFCQSKLRATRLSKYFELDESLTCAGLAEGDVNNNVCLDNVGSPLVCPGSVEEGGEERFYLKGLWAWRIDCGYNDVPGVFVNIDFFHDWVHEKLRELDEELL